jgi:predicted metal-dependent hydrolase
MNEAVFQPGVGIAERRRFTSRPLPPYSYVPGHGPHPVTNPAGHMYGHTFVQQAALDPARWRESSDYLFGLDLFNHGYYWEAHEAWEGLWHVAGRRGTIGDFLKGLIKLAAAGVKAREGNPQGVVRHARRAEELLSKVQADCRTDTFAGLKLGALIDAAKQLQCEEAYKSIEPMPYRILSIELVPENR